MKIRPARVSDTDGIFLLLMDMHGENGVVEMDAPKVYGRIRALLDGGMVLLAYENGVLVGSGAWSTQAYWYSKRARLGEWWFYVRPAHRRSGAARALIDAAKAIASDAGMPFEVNLSSPVKLGVKMRFFRKLGLQLIGATFLSQEGR